MGTEAMHCTYLILVLASIKSTSKFFELISQTPMTPTFVEQMLFPQLPACLMGDFLRPADRRWGNLGLFHRWVYENVLVVI